MFLKESRAQQLHLDLTNVFRKYLPFFQIKSFLEVKFSLEIYFNLNFPFILG